MELEIEIRTIAIRVIKEALEIIQENQSDEKTINTQCDLILKYTKEIKRSVKK